MDEQNYTPQIEVTTPAAPKKSFPVLTMVIAVVATAVVIGLAGYFFFGQQVAQTQQQAADRLQTAQVAQTQAQNDFNACQTAKTGLENQAKALSDQAQAVYSGWQDYTDSKLGLKWKYPSDWQVAEKVEPASSTFLAGFCLHFISPQSVLLNICYRQASDTASTTWFRTGIGYGELAKVGAQIPMAGRTIGQKTYYGQDGKVMTIIYGQNIKDDETGYAARIKAGDYYFTAMADDMTGKVGITPEDQTVLENILASVQLPLVLPINSEGMPAPTE